MPKNMPVKTVANNRKAFHDYFILDRFEAGVELFGTEVKSIRMGNVNLIYLLNMALKATSYACLT